MSGVLVAGLLLAISGRFEYRDLVLVEDGKETRLARLVPAYSRKMVVHSIQQRGETYYLLIGGSKPTRPGANPYGYCGAGIDEYVELVVVKDSSVVRRMKSVFVSCSDGNGAIEGWKKDGRFVWRKWHADGSVTRFSFDSGAPQKGITEVEEAKQDAPPPPWHHD